MTHFPEIPAKWAQVLTAVTPILFSESPPYIGGGALRDLLLDRKPKDIDIFVSKGDWHEEGLFRFGDVKVIKKGAPFDQDPNSWSAADDSIERIVELHCPDGLVFQFIERENNPPPREMVERFDFGICRIAWDRRGWVVHNDFVTDLKEHVFRIRGIRYPEASMKRAELFSRRFQGWNFDLTRAGGKEGRW